MKNVKEKGLTFIKFIILVVVIILVVISVPKFNKVYANARINVDKATGKAIADVATTLVAEGKINLDENGDYVEGICKKKCSDHIAYYSKFERGSDDPIVEGWKEKMQGLPKSAHGKDFKFVVSIKEYKITVWMESDVRCKRYKVYPRWVKMK